MKKRISALALLVLSLRLCAQTMTPLTLGGFNADCVYERGEVRSAQQPLDNGNWVLYSASVRSEGGLPAGFTSALCGVPYRLASFAEPNALRLTQSEANFRSGRLTPTEPVEAQMLFLLGLSANGRRDVALTLRYADGTSEQTALSFHDWYGGASQCALTGLGRTDRSSGSYDSRLEFGLFEAIVPLDSTKRLEALECQAGSGEGFSYIMAATAASNYTFPGGGPLFLLTNSHLDTQWNWDVETTIRQYLASTLTDNFARMEAYPAFRFNFEGAQKYQWMKEYYPAQWERLKRYVAEGRWNPAGGSWDANETMVASAESLLRNLLYGQTFFKREFGRKGGLDIMLPDCFGFPASLPTIAAHCGFLGFHTQKLSWGSAYDYDGLPAFGRWRGVDGSEIYCILKPGPYDATFGENLALSTEMLAAIRRNETDCGLGAHFRYTGRSGDRGGAMNDEQVGWLQRSVETEGPVDVKIATPTEAFQYMAEHDRGQYPVVDHELPMRTHGVGCYTSQTMMKYWNRRNELTADAAERAAVMADWLGTARYPHEALTRAWHRVIWHQFHDDLPGTCIPRAYGYSQNDEVMSLRDFLGTVRTSVAAVASRMDTRTDGIPLVVYNPLATEREDIVEASLPAENGWTGVRVCDAEGREVLAQPTRFAEGRQHFIFLARVPAMSLTTFSLHPNEPCTLRCSDLSLSDHTMENTRYRLTLDPQTGDISSLFDKALNQELLSSGLRLSLQKCVSTSWPAWEIPYSATRNAALYVNNADGTMAISVAEDGPLRKTFRIERTRLGSTFVQLVSLTARGERVDVENEVDWQSRGYLLKLEANLKGTNTKATYDNSLGFLERGLSTEQYYEYCGHQWADQTASGGQYGLSILNDSKYGWDKPSNTRLRMTLIYTPEVGESYAYQGHQDLGLNRFRFSLLGHEGAVGSVTQWQSDRLNQPLMAFATTAHEGELGRTFRFVGVDNPQVAVRALKRAEESDLYILRFHCLTAEPQDSVRVTFPTQLQSLQEVNGLEEPLADVPFDGNAFTFAIRGFGIKTFAFRLADEPTTATEASPFQPVELDYNADLMSIDAKRADGISTLGLLFPGELLPDTLFHEQVPYVIGPRQAGRKNVVQCRGQAISLPSTDEAQHDSLTLHLLAFSLLPEGTDMPLVVDGEERSLHLGYVRGNLADRGGFYSAPVFRPEEVAFTATHSHDYASKTDVPYDYLYLFHYSLRVPRGARTLTLPTQTRSFLAALTFEDGPSAPLTPLLDSQFVFPTPREVPADATPCNARLVPASFTASGYTGSSESPRMAADGSSYTKWCDNQTGSKWIAFTFAEEVEVCQWEVLLGGIENAGYIASALRLQYYDAATLQYVDCDVVTDNTENHLLRSMEPVTAKRFRLLLDSPEQGNGQTARVYELNLYGRQKSQADALPLLRPDLPDGPQPVYDLSGRRVGTAQVRRSVILLPPLPSGIYVVAGRKVVNGQAPLPASSRGRGEKRLRGLPPPLEGPGEVVYRDGGIIQGDPSRKRICLVFTAADRADGAERIIQTLREKGVKAGFFFTGRFYEKFPDVVRRLVADGHYVGSHSYAHLLYFPWGEPQQMSVTQAEFNADMERSYALMRRFGIKKKKARYFIPPYEHYNQQVADWARQLGLQIINYTPGTGSNADYTIPSMANYCPSDTIFRRILRFEEQHTLCGHIMLLHLGTHPERTDKFYDRLPQLIDELRRRGYRFVGVKDMVEK